jgi:hypothetical protein
VFKASKRDSPDTASTDAIIALQPNTVRAAIRASQLTEPQRALALTALNAAAGADEIAIRNALRVNNGNNSIALRIFNAADLNKGIAISALNVPANAALPPPNATTANAALPLPPNATAPNGASPDAAKQAALAALTAAIALAKHNAAQAPAIPILQPGNAAPASLNAANIKAALDTIITEAALAAVGDGSNDLLNRLVKAAVADVELNPPATIVTPAAPAGPPSTNEAAYKALRTLAQNDGNLVAALAALA